MSVVTWLLIINIGVFVLDHIVFGGFQIVEVAGQRFREPVDSPLFSWGYFSAEKAFGELQLWRLISFQFLHADFTHLFGNMLGLFMLGQLVEMSLGRRRFLAFYLICGIAGPIAYMLMSLLGILGDDWSTPLIGASAGVFGVLVAAATIAPRIIVYLLFPPIPVQMRTLALALLAIAVFTVFSDGHNSGGEAAHLGGAAVGYLLVRQPMLLDWIEKTRRNPRARMRWG